VLDVARYLASTGKYDTSTADGMTHLIDVAKSKARYVYALRGAAQFFAPTAPTPEWLARDKNGHALVAQKLVEEYQKYLDDDPQHATDKMLERYGDGIFLLLQGKTAEVTPAAPVTKAGADWERNHGDVAKRYPNVYGFFAPQGGDLDITAYGRQLSSGKRQRLTPEQAVRLANDRVGNAIYQNAKQQVGTSPSKPQRDWLRQLRDALTTQYPGFGDHSGIPEKVSTDTLVRDLTEGRQRQEAQGQPAGRADPALPRRRARRRAKHPRRPASHRIRSARRRTWPAPATGCAPSATSSSRSTPTSRRSGTACSTVSSQTTTPQEAAQ
jgi:hypothetical protein